MNPHTITLVYNPDDQTVTGLRDVRPIQVGDQLIFQSPAGEVHVKLAPVEVFGAAAYHQGDPPLQVRKRAKFQYWCGVKVNGITVGWPDNELFGNHDDTGNP